MGKNIFRSSCINNNGFSIYFLKRNNIKPNDILVGIHHGVCKQGFVWPTERFAFVINKLLEMNNVRVVLIVSSGDESLTENLIGMIKAPGLPIYYEKVATRFSALFKKITLFICNDSGIMHIAAASGCGVIALFGPSSIIQYGPFGDNCIAIKGENDKVDNITVEMVMDKIKIILYNLNQL